MLNRKSFLRSLLALPFIPKIAKDLAEENPQAFLLKGRRGNQMIMANKEFISIMERIQPFVDEYQLAYFKRQQLLSKIPPSGEQLKELDNLLAQKEDDIRNIIYPII